MQWYMSSAEKNVLFVSSASTWICLVFMRRFTPRLFLGQCGITNCSHGPIAIAIIAWQNSLVFHSLDKMTSFFIHIMPVSYVVYPMEEEESRERESKGRRCQLGNRIVSIECRAIDLVPVPEAKY